MPSLIINKLNTKCVPYARTLRVLFYFWLQKTIKNYNCTMVENRTIGFVVRCTMPSRSLRTLKSAGTHNLTKAILG